MRVNKFKNKKKEQHLKTISSFPSLEDDNNDLTIRSKFNFSYFDSSQQVGQDFRNWTHQHLHELLDKLKSYSTKPLIYWLNQRCGGGGLKILAIYGAFPNKSNFKCPKHIPHQSKWARFRLDNSTRLIGFVIPNDLDKTVHCKTKELFDKNTFYAVFLDENHQFYLTEDK